MSFEENTKLLTNSSSASSSEAQQEEFPAESEELGTSQPSRKLPIKPNMVAQEVRVMATGASAGKTTNEREIFAEETTSILVGENGGVIRLSAGVIPGQLLFLSNVESKMEVVAQVKRKRADRPTSCYVELEFTEPAPRFWGVTFSAASALLPKDAREKEVAEQVISAEAADDEPNEPIAAPTAEELQAFKRSAETLRRQAKLMQRLGAIEPEAAPAPPAVPEAPGTPASADVPSTESNSTSGWNEPSEVGYPDRSVHGEPEPVVAPLTAAEEELLPKPSLDFRPPKVRRARGNFTPNFRKGALRLMLLTAALVFTTIAALWEMNWIPWKAGAKKTAVSKPANSGGGSKAPLDGNRTTAVENSELNSKMASDEPVTSPALPRMEKPGITPERAVAAKSPSQTLAVSRSVELPAVKKTTSTLTPSAKAFGDRPTARAASDLATRPSSGDVLVPPKLIKSVRAEASLDDLHDFETGNVVIDAVVGTHGEVHFISVLSGPPSLRRAAVEALKQYVYEPAMLHDQPVPAHVTITVRFHFEP